MDAAQAVTILLGKARKLEGKMNLSKNEVLMIDAIYFAVDAIVRDDRRSPQAGGES